MNFKGGFLILCIGAQFATGSTFTAQVLNDAVYPQLFSKFVMWIAQKLQLKKEY